MYIKVVADRLSMRSIKSPADWAGRDATRRDLEVAQPDDTSKRCMTGAGIRMSEMANAFIASNSSFPRSHQKADIPMRPGVKREGDNKMLIGIDVGGTTTDAVLIDGDRVAKAALVPTDVADLPGCLLKALDELVEDIDKSVVERVVLSTTIITNLIAEGKTDPVGLILVPGPGTNPKDLNLPKAEIIDGAIDFRGREIQKLDEAGARRAVRSLASQGLRKVAVVGKFGQRNHAHELSIQEIASNEAPGLSVGLGHQVSGKLNFPRRAATTLLTMATRDRYREFALGMASALRDRGIFAPAYILKADGGTVPLERSIEMPVETIFSGPAASIMGVMALGLKDQTSVVVDIGGTTTDLALILSGRPLLSSKGARVDSMLTHVRAFAVKSVAIGGDSAVRVIDGNIQIGPDRLGRAFCLGGPSLTPTDALRALGLCDIGDASRADEALFGIGQALGCSKEEAARRVVDAVVEKIAFEVNEMFMEWEEEPAYRIWEILQREKVRPENVVGVGGASPAFIPLVAKRLGAKGIVPPHAAVANAIGAAVARPTLTLNLRIDTEQGVYAVSEDGASGKVSDRKMNLDQAEVMARRLMQERARDLGIEEYVSEAEVTHSELFNMVRGWSTVGRLLDVRMEIPAGLISSWGGA